MIRNATGVKIHSVGQLLLIYPLDGSRGGIKYVNLTPEMFLHVQVKADICTGPERVNDTVIRQPQWADNPLATAAANNLLTDLARFSDTV